ncbi:hypothetical protein BDP27DRAFT_1289483 [Rhodocollybia butyracea]|uniref:F-box domain-containing protein n=1 Tax=Rhodocollybia butyracea TaxID=206335 RepID=A0A9P5UAQ6_9AGAR|nr:hypothetical protein BDP27DRAFT_1289483 [Rhodocollybia butyracea]
MECPIRGKEVIKPLAKFGSRELAELRTELRSEYGPFVVNPARAQALKEILAFADKESEEACLHDRLRLEKRVEILRSILSPMRRLPNESLLRIFEYVCDENFLQSYPWNDFAPPTKLTFPVIVYLPTMAISSVCFRWRELALSSPGLWASLIVQTCSIPSSQVKSLVGFISTLELFLERSGDWPLRLALDTRGDKEMDYFLAPLTRHTHRWKTFKYRGQYSLTTSQVLSNFHFPLLVELDLRSNFHWVQPSDLDRFEYSPRLRTLVTNRTPPPECKIPLHQLHYAEFGIDFSEDLEEALRNCSSLRSVALRRADSWFLEQPERESIWRNITSLVIREPSVQPWNKVSDEVFPFFSFPSLTELRVERLEQRAADSATAWPRDVFISFVSRSSCMITKFTIRGISLSDLDLIASLKVMPSLLHLEVDDKGPIQTMHRSPITPRLIASLIQNQSNETLPNSLVPKLHSLRLLFDGKTFDDLAFVSMVQSRWFKPGSDLHAAKLTMGIGCIRSVVLKFSRRDVVVESYKPLRVLDEEGLRVVVAGKKGVQI